MAKHYHVNFTEYWPAMKMTHIQTILGVVYMMLN